MRTDDCPRCHRVFHPHEEQCPDCGFDPVNNEEDEKEYEEYTRVKVSFGQNDIRNVIATYRDGKKYPADMEGYEFMEVLGGGWYAFRI